MGGVHPALHTTFRGVELEGKVLGIRVLVTLQCMAPSDSTQSVQGEGTLTMSLSTL